MPQFFISKSASPYSVAPSKPPGQEYLLNFLKIRISQHGWEKFSFKIFKLLENAFGTQKNESRHFYSCPPSGKIFPMFLYHPSVRGKSLIPPGSIFCKSSPSSLFGESSRLSIFGLNWIIKLHKYNSNETLIGCVKVNQRCYYIYSFYYIISIVMFIYNILYDIISV